MQTLSSINHLGMKSMQIDVIGTIYAQRRSIPSGMECTLNYFLLDSSKLQNGFSKWQSLLTSLHRRSTLQENVLFLRLYGNEMGALKDVSAVVESVLVGDWCVDEKVAGFKLRDALKIRWAFTWIWNSK